MADQFKIEIKGNHALERELKAIAAEDGEKSVNKVCRDAAKDSIKRIVIPDAKNLAPEETGELVRHIKARTLPRSRSRVGATAGFKNSLFQGPTFYAGFHEFGWTTPSGTTVEADSFLRRALYTNERRIRGKFHGDMKRWIRRRNSVARL